MMFSDTVSDGETARHTSASDQPVEGLCRAAYRTSHRETDKVHKHRKASTEDL